MRRRTFPRWAALLFIGLGAYILLLSLGIIEAHPGPGARRGLLPSPRDWAVGVFGLALVGIGLGIAFPMAPRRWLRLSRAIAALAFIAAMTKFIYFSGLPVEEQWLFSVPLAVAVLVALWAKAKGLKIIPDLDPLEAARVLRQHGRTEQADAVLQRAIREQPWRAAELQRALDIARRQ
jgi:hypothetical protein